MTWKLMPRPLTLLWPATGLLVIRAPWQISYLLLTLLLLIKHYSTEALEKLCPSSVLGLSVLLNCHNSSKLSETSKLQPKLLNRSLKLKKRKSKHLRRQPLNPKTMEVMMTAKLQRKRNLIHSICYLPQPSIYSTSRPSMWIARTKRAKV